MKYLILALALLTAGMAAQKAPPQEQTTQSTAPHVPAPKSAAELQAYKAALSTDNPVVVEKSADDFAAKFPDSELRGPLYQRAMLLYQHSGNPDKTLEVGEKALKLLPDDPVTLTALASTLAEHTDPNELDREQRWDDSLRYSQRALKALDVMPAPPGVSPAAMNAARVGLRSIAYSSMGVIYYDHKDFAKAEESFAKSIAADKTHADPALYLRLAVAQKYQGKDAEAARSADQAIALAPNSPTARLATQFKQDLRRKAGSGSGVPASPDAQTGTATVPNANPK